MTQRMLVMGAAGFIVGRNQNPMLAPPSTGSTAPVMNFAAGEQRKTAAQPMSSGSPKRPIGVRERILFERAASPSSALRNIGDSIHPGAMALTRTPRPETSDASERTMPT